MGLSGFLYVAIVVGWAVYLVPFALKRYDEAARNRSIDRFSSAMRVLGRREAAGPARAQQPDGSVTPAPSPPVARRQEAQRSARRAAARTAARRRRRVLLMLLLATAGTAGAAGFERLAWWSVAVPATLVVLWLVLCRTQARREYGAAAVDPREDIHAARTADPSAEGGDEEDTAGDHVAPDVDVVGVISVPAAVPADDEPTVVLSREDLGAAEEEYAGTGSLWDPVPVTLPTYVHKPRAPRTIRTIDLGATDVQTAGHTEPPAAPAAPAQPGQGHQAGQSTQPSEPQHADAEAEPSTDERRPDVPTRRAVGE